MRGLGDENGVAPPERLPVSERAHPRPPVFGATLFHFVRGAGTSWSGQSILTVGGGIDDGPVFAESRCALGGVEPC